MTFKCSTCDDFHEGLPDFGFQWPDPYFDIPQEERDTRIIGDSDLCTIDETNFFIRGVIQIPVNDYERPFGIGVWISQKRENYEKYRINPDSIEIGPFFGWLCNSIGFYDAETQLLKTTAHFQGNNLRPVVKVNKSDHQLYKDWSKGITLEKAFEYIHRVS